jgi:hypothetical protein
MKFINLLKKELAELINVQMILSLVVTMGIFMVVYSFFFVQGFGVSLTLCLYNTKRSVHMYGLNAF